MTAFRDRVPVAAESPAAGRTLADLVTAHATWSPDRVAVIDDAGEHTYGALATRVTALAHGLVARGVGRGGVVAVAADPARDVVALYLATARIGAVLVPLNTRLRAAELGDVLARTRPDLVLTAAGHAPLVRAAADAEPVADGPDGTWGDLLAADPGGALPTGGPDDPHLVLFTSGTTGRPKAAVLSQRRSLGDAANAALASGVRADDRLLGYQPLYHTGGWDFLKQYLLVGGSVVLMPRFDADRALELLERHRCTAVFAVPLVLLRLLESPRFGRTDLSAFRRLMFASYEPSALVPRAVAAFGGRGARDVRVEHVYGQTEAGSFVTTCARGRHRRRLGRPPRQHRHPGARRDGRAARPGAAPRRARRGRRDLRARRDRDDRLPRRPRRHRRGVPRRLAAHRPTSAAGPRRPAADRGTAQGDDPHGRRERLPQGGRGPARHPPRRDRRGRVRRPRPAVGRAGRRRGRPGRRARVTPDELVTYLRERIAGYKVPREVHLVAELPKTPAGKTARHRLPDLLPGLQHDVTGSTLREDRRRAGRAERSREPDGDAAGATGATRGVEPILSIERSVAVLALFTAHRTSLSLAEMAEQLPWARATLHRYAVSLRQAGMLSYDQRSARYSLGPMVVRLGTAALNGLPLAQLAGPHLARLVRATHVTAMLSVWDGEAPLVIRENDDTDQLVSLKVREGSRLPAYDSAAGQVFLAFSEAARARLRADTDARRGLAERAEALDRIRRERLAYTEALTGLRAVASPVFQADEIVARSASSAPSRSCPGKAPPPRPTRCSPCAPS
ncbi:hypothetical protein BJF78_04090 [Pseudonocardia sp. CNS-139]|nr:hypothetical protein BJF78_04090 [Pseudonocardia sp. CNS-139]